MQPEMAPHVQDITRALGGKVSEQEIEKELQSYLNVYRVSLDTAKRSIVKKHGGNPAQLSVGVQRSIKDLVPGEGAVNLLARIVSANEKTIETEQGSKTILFGILGDPTGTVPFTAWEPLDFALGRGEVVRVQAAYTKEFRGQVQVNFGVRTVVTKESSELLPPWQPRAEGAAEVVARSPVVPAKATPIRLADLREGASNVAVTARVLSIERREVNVDGTAKTVFSGVLADESGKSQFSAWTDFRLGDGDAVRIEGAYVKSWRGLLQVGFDDRSRVTKLEPDALPPVEALSASPRIWIEDLAERGGGVDVTVRGILIDIKDGSGLIARCPECRRVLRKNVCRIHGEVAGQPDLRVKAIVDDGSGALTAVFGRDLTEGLLDRTIEEAIAQAKNAMNADVVRDDLADLLVAQPVEVRGNVTSDEYGLMMIVDQAKLLKVDVQEEARAMLEELGGPA